MIMLPDADFKIVYSTGESEPVEFFIDALLESNSFDLGLGFFSTSGFRTLAPGFAFFIHQGGKMRIIFNDILSHDDKHAIERGGTINPNDLIEKKIVDDLLLLCNTLSSTSRHFFNCISWLIATKRLEMLAIRPKLTRGGIAHQKFGIFKDAQSNSIAFSGSINFSHTALQSNLEAISCYKSWTRDNSDNARISYYSSLFNRIWQNQYDAVQIIPIEKVKAVILEKFPVRSEEDIFEEEYALADELLETPDVSEGFLRKLNELKERLAIHASSKVVPPKGVTVRQYQNDAYDSWVKNNCSGIFAMATGTGKTITALNCIYKEYIKHHSANKDVKYHLLVLVPSQPLLNQWSEELSDWKIDKQYLASGKYDWRSQLQELVNDFSFDIDSSFAVLATYQTFTNEVFQDLLKKLPGDTILIADEAHNMGQANVKKCMSAFPFTRRIGLSATPKRNYDPEGTAVLEHFFHDKEPYCFSYTMEEAIKDGRLCRYHYFPKLVELTPNELEEYVSLTKRIAQLSSSSREEDQYSSSRDSLLLMRKRIINKAQGKLMVLEEIIKDIGKRRKLKYCFTYAPDGDNEELTVDEDNKRFIREMQLVFEKISPKTRSHVYLGETQNREQILKGFENGKIDVLLAIKCLDEGIDIPRAEIGIFTASTGNPRQYIQRRGRLLRQHKDKHQAIIYDMVVIPRIFGEPDQERYFQIERNLVRNELMRVGYFAMLSENFYDTKEELEKICKFYKLDLDTIIKDLEQ